MATQKSIDRSFIDESIDVLREGRKLRRKLPTWGQILIERQLPFLCVYRQPPKWDDWGTGQLLIEESSYLVASAKRQEFEGVKLLVDKIAEELSGCFGTFLIVEIWSGPDLSADQGPPIGAPGFRIFHKRGKRASSYVQTLIKQLQAIKFHDMPAQVTVQPLDKIAPPGLSPLLTTSGGDSIHIIGIEVTPIYRNQAKKEVYPAVFKQVQKRFSTALEKAFFEFLKKETTICPPNYMSLGRRSIVHSVWQVDRVLAEVANLVDFLLLVTPTNTDEAFDECKRKGFTKPPRFVYHSPPFDPVTLKRLLYKAPVERIEDPTLAQLFRDQQLDIDSRITMVSERGSKRFLYHSLQLYDGPDERLVKLAVEIMEKVSERSIGESTKKLLSAEEFARLAEDLLDTYRAQCPDLQSRVEIRSDVPGVLVSQGNLLIGKERKIFQARAEALLSHEVGTHILTNYNGHHQPFKQLSSGLPGCDQLQEALAVLAEYLVGGLSKRRLRTLAARVIAVHLLIQGAEFLDVFRQLNEKYEMHDELAFMITMRVFRSGGFTKDVVYLRGLLELMQELRNGLDLDMLYLGKFGIDQLSIVRELISRKVLVPAKIRPHFLDTPSAQQRLSKVRKGISVIELVSKN